MWVDRRSSAGRFGKDHSGKGLTLLLCSLLMMMVVPQVGLGGGYKPPDDCLAKSGDSFQQCLYATIDLQAEEIAKLQEQVKTQEAQIQDLRAQLDARAASAVQLQSQVQEQHDTIQDLRTQARRTPFVYGPPYSPFYGSPYGAWGGGIGMCVIGC